MCHDFHQHSRILLKTLRVGTFSHTEGSFSGFICICRVSLFHLILSLGLVDDNDDRVDDSYYDDDDNADDLCKLSARCRRFA